jgi:hypothetical protein
VEEVAWVVAASSGCGLASLRRSLLKPGHEQVTIRRAATRVRGGMLLKEPKSRKGKRAIPLMADTVEALKRQKLRCEELERAAADWTPNDLVFPTRAAGRCETTAC